MLEVAFSCPLCSRMFVVDCPYEEARIPDHRDPLIGTACEGSDTPLVAYLEIPEHPHPFRHMEPGLDWPRYRRRR